MGESKQEIGSYGNWLAIRLTEVFIFFVAAPALYALQPTGELQLAAGAFLAVCIALLWDPIAWGTASGRGIVFRRYFGRHFLSWEQVERVDWSPAWLVVVRREGWLLRRRVFFPLRSSGDLLAGALGREPAEPEAVARLRELLPVGQVELRSVQRVNPRQAKVALAVFLVLAIFTALVAWWFFLR